MITYARTYNSFHDGLIYEGQPLPAHVAQLAAAGKAVVAHYGDNPKAARGWHVRTKRGGLRALAIRQMHDGSAYSRPVGVPHVVALPNDA